MSGPPPPTCWPPCRTRLRTPPFAPCSASWRPKGTLAKDGPRYVYRPTRARPAAARSAVAQVMQTFFAGSVEQTVAALLSATDAPLTGEQHARLLALIDDARAKGDAR